MPLRIPRWLLVGLASLALIGVGVAGTLLVVTDSTGEDGAADAPEPQVEEASLVYARRCEQQTRSLLAGLEGLESRLAIGLAYQEYLRRVGDARVAYDRIPVNDLDLRCINAVAPAEKALRTHLEAAEVWTKCVRDRDCEHDSSRLKLRRKWKKASSQLEQSRQALRALKQ